VPRAGMIVAPAAPEVVAIFASLWARPVWITQVIRLCLPENVAVLSHVSVSPMPRLVPDSRRRPRLQPRTRTIARRHRVRQGRRAERSQRSGTPEVPTMIATPTGCGTAMESCSTAPR
jgi:hypothetical protein